MPETKKYKKGIAITATLAVLIGASFSAYMWSQRSAISPHYVDTACAVCHAYVQGTCTSADCNQCHTIDIARYWNQLKAPELELCTSCHGREGDIEVENAEGLTINVDLGRSHPWGMTPKLESTPNTLPLKDGVVTCQTCHDVHLTNIESHMLRLYKPQDGKGADFTPLCADCHGSYL